MGCLIFLLVNVSAIGIGMFLIGAGAASSGPLGPPLVIIAFGLVAIAILGVRAKWRREDAKFEAEAAQRLLNLQDQLNEWEEEQQERHANGVPVVTFARWQREQRKQQQQPDSLA